MAILSTDEGDDSPTAASTNDPMQSTTTSPLTIEQCGTNAEGRSDTANEATPVADENAAPSSSTPTSTTTTGTNTPHNDPKLCFEQSHCFHTNPSISRPNLKQLPPSTHFANTPSLLPSLPEESQQHQTTKARKRKERLALYKQQQQQDSNGPSPVKGSESIGNVGSNKGIPCLSAWARTLQHPKTVELLAIASPLSSSPSSPANAPPVEGSSPESYFDNCASRVYVLVFDEGAFSQKEFHIWNDICDLLGIPMEEIDSSYPIVERVKEHGLRREVFRLLEDRALASEGGGGNRGEGSSGADATTSFGWEFGQTLLHHLSKECQNCVRAFQQEIVGDGRLFNDGYSIGGEPVDAKGNKIPPPHGSKKKTSKSQPPASPVKPTIGFQVLLPYSSTSMEVTNLEWSADGTTLSIVQKRKGSGSLNVASSSVGLNVTNKKKKGSNAPSIAPGSTAVSFWTIPEWLLDYDEQAGLYDFDAKSPEDGGEEQDPGLMFKNQGHGYSDDVGWEVEDEDETKSLFPMWEWYLSKYIFKDELLLGAGASNKKNRREQVLMKNMVDAQAYPMELNLSSSSGASSVTSGLSSRHGKKSGMRANKGGGGGSCDGSSVIQGDVTCLFWEETDTFSWNKNDNNDNQNDTSEDGDKKSSDATTKDNGMNGEKESSSEITNTNAKNENTPPSTISSRWIAFGTSKGQMVLHNTAASYLANHVKKAKNKSNAYAVNAASLLSASQARTITIPSRQKKRITCGAWLENLLVFGSVGSGSLTVVSTFPKVQENQPVNSGNGKLGQEKGEDLFKEKNVKVLGNLVLPGGRDAHSIQMNIIKDYHGPTTTLSVNCEGRSLLFYVFPKLIDESKSHGQQGSQITSSPAIEISFMKKSSSASEVAFSSQSKSGRSYNSRGGVSTPTGCGTIIDHYLIANTFLVVVVFSNGYVAMVDWANSVIIHDAEIGGSNGEEQSSSPDSSSNSRKDLEQQERVILDTAFHLPTCTLVRFLG